MSTAVASAAPAAPMALAQSQGLDDGSVGATTEDPPDTQHHQQQEAELQSDPRSPPVPINFGKPRGTADSSGSTTTSPLVAYSPSTAEGGFPSSVSDYDHEHELDSPSSLSSWNSWAGGRRGDLADVEDFELEGGVHEPELETVSELDEESSSFCSGSDRINGMLDSDDDARSGSGTGSTASGSRQSSWSTSATSAASSLQGTPSHEHSPRRKQYRLSDHLAGMHVANSSHHHHHYHHGTNGSGGHNSHYASHLHPHGTPTYPHFSPRAGGHGLSHHSRYLQRAPPNVAARRRKGRLAELAEEPGGSGGDAVKTTKMPTTPRAGPVPDRDVPPVPGSDASDLSARSDVADDTTVAGPSDADMEALEAVTGLSQDDIGPMTPTPNIRNDFEIFGPPAPPVRCVSPSETVPVVPSPLCECVTAPEDDANVGTETEAPALDNAPACETPREERSLTPTLEEGPATVSQGAAEDADATIEAPGSGTGSPPSPTASGISLEQSANRSTPPSTPPTSPQISRSVSYQRRLSSPTQMRSAGKKPLRPCFKRGYSTQSSRAVSSRDSSVERNESRGRTKVRFSPAPPVEVRTHSPVDYDRKACPINNRLSADDLEELRNMKMEMGLLEAKCAALSAIKPEESAAQTESESETEQCVARWTARTGRQGQSPANTDRKRADSISSSSPTTFCGARFASGKPQAAPSPADYLRMEREKERERVCRMAGIGVGAGFRWTGGSSGKPNTRQMPHGGCEALGASLMNRWGLSKPPPPLPGLPASAPGSPGWSGFSAKYGGSHQDHGQDNSYAPPSPKQVTLAQLRPNSTPPGYARPGPSESDVAAELDAVTSAQQPESKLIAPKPVVPPQEALTLAEKAEQADQVLDEPRGRAATKDFGVRRKGQNDSTSTDATVTPANKSIATADATMTSDETKPAVPSLTHTAPSPETSPDRPHSRSRSPVEERIRHMYASSLRQGQAQQSGHYGGGGGGFGRPSAWHGSAVSSSTSPTSINSVAALPPVSPMSSRPSFGSGYDSPASEFYESGSEYDLLG